MKRMIGLGAAALALGACSGEAGNNGAAQNGANAAAPANAAADAASGPRSLSLDHAQLEAACIPAAEREMPIDELTAERRAALNSCFNTETVRQLTPRLPIRIDSATELDQASVAGPALVYRYRISQRLADMPAGMGERVEAHTRSNACAGEDVRQIIALGGVQVYRWVDRDQALIREVRIDACPEEGAAAQ